MTATAIWVLVGAFLWFGIGGYTGMDSERAALEMGHPKPLSRIARIFWIIVFPIMLFRIAWDWIARR